jgi:ELWxxDGT repeat protein
VEGLVADSLIDGDLGLLHLPRAQPFGPKITTTSNPQYLTVVNGVLCFSVAGGLWKSEGTAAGTVLVRDIAPGSTGSFDQIANPELTNVNGRLYFQANDGVHGNEPWTSDGTAAGTVMLQDRPFRCVANDRTDVNLRLPTPIRR